MTGKKRVLLVDDDVELCQLLAEFLVGSGFEVDYVHQGQTAVGRLAHAAERDGYDAVVLDIMMPGMSGLDVLQNVRRHNNVPIIMLTGRGDDIDRIVGLEMGADDYLGKPCNPRELAARLTAVLRRSAATAEVPTEPVEPVSGFGINVDPRSLQASYQGETIDFTSAEFRTLQILMQHAGETLSKEFLTEKVLNRKLSAHDRSIDVHISRVRQKLTKYTRQDSLIKSVRGVGYQFLVET